MRSLAKLWLRSSPSLRPACAGAAGVARKSCPGVTAHALEPCAWSDCQAAGCDPAAAPSPQGGRAARRHRRPVRTRQEKKKRSVAGPRGPASGPRSQVPYPPGACLSAGKDGRRLEERDAQLSDRPARNGHGGHCGRGARAPLWHRAPLTTSLPPPPPATHTLTAPAEWTPSQPPPAGRTPRARPLPPARAGGRAAPRRDAQAPRPGSSSSSTTTARPRPPTAVRTRAISSRTACRPRCPAPPAWAAEAPAPRRPPGLIRPP